ncbi:MAG: glycosyltransferase [Candidatus Aenigmatarchaeota archaeon]
MISVIIPTKNEPYVKYLVKEIKKTLKRDFEIIIVEASNKLPKIKNVKVIKQKGTGLGKAFLQGLKHAKGDIIVLMDGDGSHSPKFLPSLIKNLNDSDIVVGSRFIKDGKTLDETHRRIISFIFRKFAAFILGLDLKDNMSGFAAFKRSVFDKIKPDAIGYKIVLETAYKAKKKGLKIKEVPITFYPRRMGKSKSTVLEGLKTIFLIFKLRFFS